MKTLHDLLRSFASLAILMTTAGFASAATINWGDFSDPEGSVTFVDVSEDNDEDSTVFDGEDGPDVMGNMLIFDPQGFQSQASNGSDLIDSELSFMVVPQEPTWIETIRIEEFGDYTLGGLSNGEAIASVGAVFFWTINEVDGEPVSLPMQVTQLDVSGGGMYVRPDNDGTAQPWTGYAELNVADVLEEFQIDGDATKITVTFDNTLQTAADNFSNAFIKKKGVKITVDTVDMKIPEPTTAMLAAFGIGAAFLRRRG